MNTKLETFYNYRSIKDFKRFMDILVHNRLYSTDFGNLNDPMEGVFTFSSKIESSIITKLKDEKSKMKICSFSRTYKHGLMWSFYADEHRGCCFEVEVDDCSDLWEKVLVDDKENFYNLNDSSTVIEILSRKSKQWNYEKEVRFLKESNTDTMYLPVKIKKIYLGMRMCDEDKKLIKKIVNAINSGIEIIEMKKEDIDFGYL